MVRAVEEGAFRGLGELSQKRGEQSLAVEIVVRREIPEVAKSASLQPEACFGITLAGVRDSRGQDGGPQPGMRLNVAIRMDRIQGSCEGWRGTHVSTCPFHYLKSISTVRHASR